MKIMTLNTWQESGEWEKRWEVTLEGMSQFQPEIAVFQELFNRSWAAEVQKRAGFASLVFPSESCGLALLTQYPVGSWGIKQLPPSPLEEYSRYVLWAELKVQGGPLVILNTHLSWKLEDGVTRKRQVKELLQVVREKASRAESILVGDLNSPPNSLEIEELIQEGKFRDLFKKMHPGEAGFSWNNRNPYAGGSFHKMPDRRIDYILARGSGGLLKNLLRCDLVFTEPNSKGVWASDHFGLLAEFK